MCRPKTGHGGGRVENVQHGVARRPRAFDVACSCAGLAHLGTHDYEQAIKQFETSVSLGRIVLPKDNPVRFADVAALGACYRQTNRVAESHKLLEEALTSYATHLGQGGGSPNVACVMCQYGLTLVREARFTEAETMPRQAVAQYDRPKSSPC